MTKIVVFSDSHHYIRGMEEILSWEKPHLCLHLGDVGEDTRELEMTFPHIRFEGVRGNCDFFPKKPVNRVIDVEEVRLFATHGHAYDVKYDPQLRQLQAAALMEEADIALYGHTHIPHHARYGDLEILNPGSAGRGGQASYGVITVEGRQAQVSLCTWPRQG